VRAAVDGDGEEVVVRHEVAAGVAGEDYLTAVLRPANGQSHAREMGEPGCFATLGGHDVDLRDALIVADEGDPTPIGGEDGAPDWPFACRKTTGDAAFAADDPEVVIAAEDEFVAVDRGRAVVAALRSRSGRRWQLRQRASLGALCSTAAGALGLPLGSGRPCFPAGCLLPSGGHHATLLCDSPSRESRLLRFLRL
jgi:hypothetical protein